jgi:hypothetical protein
VGQGEGTPSLESSIQGASIVSTFFCDWPIKLIAKNKKVGQVHDSLFS